MPNLQENSEPNQFALEMRERHPRFTFIMEAASAIKKLRDRLSSSLFRSRPGNLRPMQNGNRAERNARDRTCACHSWEPRQYGNMLY